MREKMFHKFASAILAFVLIAVSVFTATQSVTAATSTKTLIHVQSKKAVAFDVNRYNFKISNTADVEINVYVPAPKGVTLTLRDSNKKVIGNPMILTNYDSAWVLDGRGWYTYKYVVKQMKQGNYSVDYVFDEETEFDAKIIQTSAKVSFSTDKITVTKGFKKQLKVNNANITSWKSNNNSVATVNHNGIVIGKKTGSTTIVAYYDNGKSVTCKVNVKSNIYSAKKITKADVGISEYAVSAYYAAYQSNGNMVIKFRVANGTSKKITSIPKLNITVANEKNRVIAGYSKKSFSVNVPAHSTRTYSITIKKDSIAPQKADLRNSIIEINGERVHV